MNHAGPRSAQSRFAAWGLLSSLALHMSVLGALSRTGPSEVHARTPIEFDVINDYTESPTTNIPAGADPNAPAEAAPPLTHGRRNARSSGAGDPSTGATRAARPTRGGTSLARSTVLLLAEPTALTLRESLLNQQHAQQIQRIDVGRHATSYDNRRATPNPEDSARLLTGPGHGPWRDAARSDPADSRRAAEVHAAAIATHDDTPSTTASDHGAMPMDEGPSMGAAPNATSSPDTRSGTSTHQRTERAPQLQRRPMAHARPDLARGPVATPAQTRSRPSDAIDAEGMAAMFARSWVDATTESAAQQGPGPGGRSTDGEAGHVEGRGAGSRASPSGPGDPHGNLLQSRAYLTWHATVRRRVRARLVFPRARDLALDQGSVVLDLRIAASGQLAGACRVHRRSEFADFDAAALRAVEQAVPLPPPPRELLGMEQALPLRLVIPFENPLVR